MYEYKIINKYLMAERYHPSAAWAVGPNIFETMRAYLLWDYSKDMIPHYPPSCIDLHDLHEWRKWLDKPNSPYKRVWKISQEEYREWLKNFDFTKPFDRAIVESMFTDDLPAKMNAVEVDAIAIAEAENE